MTVGLVGSSAWLGRLLKCCIALKKSENLLFINLMIAPNAGPKWDDPLTFQHRSITILVEHSDKSLRKSINTTFESNSVPVDGTDHTGRQ